MKILSTGKIVYFNTWAVVECEEEIAKYYRYFIQSETGVKLNKPKFGCHISLIRGEDINPVLKIPLWKKYHENNVDFFYTPELHTNGEHWWLNVEAPTLSELRLEMELPANPPFGFHMTLGRDLKS